MVSGPDGLATLPPPNAASTETVRSTRVKASHLAAGGHVTSVSAAEGGQGDCGDNTRTKNAHDAAPIAAATAAL